jgi:type I restriction enzyme S subunit
MSYPKTWDEVPLIDLCLEPFANGITLTQDSMGHGAKLVNIVDLYESYIIDIHSLGRANASKQQLKKSELKKGDIVFVRSSVKREGAAMCAYFPGDKEPVVFGCFNIRFRPRPELVDSKFITLFLRSLEGRSRLLNVCQTATITNINQDNLGLVSVPLPPLAEQKRIAAIAQKADRLRRTRRYALQLSDTYLQSVFLEMFGDPVTNPKGWETGALGDVIISAKDGPHVSPTYSDSGIPFLSTRNVRKGQIIWEDLKFIAPEDVKEHWKKCKPERGDILYTKGGTTGLAKAVDFDTEIAVWVHIAVLKLKHERVNPAWLENMLNSDFCYKQSQELTFGIVNRDLGLQRMPRIKIYIPPLPLQEKFAQIVQKFERLRTQQREGDRQAEHLFQTLLHRAFRGELTPQDTNDEPTSVLLEQIGAEQAQAEAEANGATQAMGDAGEYLGTKAKQQDTEPIQLTLPGIE